MILRAVFSQSQCSSKKPKGVLLIAAATIKQRQQYFLPLEMQAEQ